MRLHFEATETRVHEGIEELSAEEAAKYQALTTETERTAWILQMVVDLVSEDNHCDHQEIEDGWHAFVSDD